MAKKTAQERKWQREADLRILQEAQEIQASKERIAGARREAEAQARQLKKIVKKGSTKKKK